MSNNFENTINTYNKKYVKQNEEVTNIDKKFIEGEVFYALSSTDYLYEIKCLKNEIRVLKCKHKLEIDNLLSINNFISTLLVIFSIILYYYSGTS